LNIVRRVDMSRVAEREISAVYWDAAEGVVTGRCPGPTAEGICPQVASGEPVACAGRVINVLEKQPNGHWKMVGPEGGLLVEAKATVCPVTALGY
jgi:hypothetical protein